MRYGVVQVQVQVDLQVGQRPAETFFQIRGEERMEKVLANEEKEERTRLARGGRQSERGEREGKTGKGKARGRTRG